jgi:hypothetical protein
MTPAEKRRYAAEVVADKARVRKLLRPLLRPGVKIDCGNMLAGGGFTLSLRGHEVYVDAVGDDHTYLAVTGGKK